MAGGADVHEQQRQCGQHARFYTLWPGKSADNTSGSTSWFENHYDWQLNKCFVLVFWSRLAGDFLEIDFYDANEHKHYAEFNGHSMCDPETLKFIHKTGKCVLDSANIWRSGDDQEEPDMHLGWSGLIHGAYREGPETKAKFMQAIRPFMSQ
ncbi:MAG: hypothetical protein ACREE2_02725 [Stellaceae bacterium]